MMGFTWLFGFLANIIDNIYLWYPFIVFNTLQGVFIGASFTMTKTVLNHYKTKFGKDQNVMEALDPKTSSTEITKL